TVCMNELDPLNGVVVCTSCGPIYTGPSVMNCSFNATPDLLNPSTIHYSANAPAGSTITWDFGDNTSGTGTSVHHTYNSIGYFQVCMTADYFGTSCTACDSVPVSNTVGNCSFT